MSETDEGARENSVLYRVKYKERGTPGFNYTKPMSQQAATDRRDLMCATLGDDVIESIEIEAVDPVESPKAEGQASSFPVQFLRASLDRDKEVDDSLETTEQKDLPRILEAGAKIQLHDRAQRRIAVDYALRMRERNDDCRTSDELVADAQTILDFLNG
jgi:hypothetical protein